MFDIDVTRSQNLVGVGGESIKYFNLKNKFVLS
jgi:hypothetical protein